MRVLSIVRHPSREAILLQICTPIFIFFWQSTALIIMYPRPAKRRPFNHAHITFPNYPQIFWGVRNNRCLIIVALVEEHVYGYERMASDVSMSGVLLFVTGMRCGFSLDPIVCCCSPWRGAMCVTLYKYFPKQGMCFSTCNVRLRPCRTSSPSWPLP